MYHCLSTQCTKRWQQLVNFIIQRTNQTSLGQLHSLHDTQRKMPVNTEFELYVFHRFHTICHFMQMVQ